MREMKRILSVLLCLLMAVSLLPGAALAAESEAAEESAVAEEVTMAEAAGELTEDEPVEGERFLASSGSCGDNLTWTLDDEGTLTISGTGEMSSHPWSSGAVKKVIINSGVTSIGERAFADCSGLTSISLLASVTSIGADAFDGCSSLTDISLPDSVTSIGERAFYYCSSLTSISIPAGVTDIGYSAFYGCSSLTSISIPAGVTDIGNYAFWNCSSLTDVYYAGTETEWNSIRFNYGNDALTKATIHYNSQMPMPIVGDVDGDGKAALSDVSLIYRFLTGEATGVDASVADVTGDGKVTLRDVAALFKLCQK